MARAEIEQSRRTAIAGLVFNTLGLIVVPFVGGDPTAAKICLLALALSELNNAWLLYVSSSEQRYAERHLIAYFAIAAVLNGGVIYHIGVFGAVLVMFALNLYTASLGYSRRVALVALVGAALPVVALGSLITLGALRDPGLLTTAPGTSGLGRASVVVAFVVFLVLVYLQGREARQLLVSSSQERDEAVRRASHREALFLEARQELERALQAGGLGRFTDQTIGSYRLGEVLGRGGMGEVYAATREDTGEQAAVKLLLPEVLSRPDHVRRFLREVRMVASLDSVHVVRVLEIGDESAPLPYLAMERLQGEDLAHMLRRETRLSPRETLELVRQIGRGIEAAAAAGIVHRDLKPQNVFCTEPPDFGAPVWKILDFGVAKLTHHSGTLTVDEMLGTPQYMSPEQARQAEVTAKTDLYALGAIAYRALTGHPPFRGRDVGEIILSVISHMPVRPSALARLHDDVDLALAIALAKDPADRFESPAALADALQAAFAGRLPEPVRDAARRLLAALPWQELIAPSSRGRRPSRRPSA
jgi:serine/threonine-protein kinase